MATLEEIQRRLPDKASQRDTQRPANEPCPLKDPPVLYVMVARDDTFAEISGINVEARKSPAIKPSQKSGGDGIASFDPLKPVDAGPSQILALLDANQKKQFLPPQACQQVTTAKGKTETAVVLLSPLLPLKVNVIGEKDNKPVNDVELLLDGRSNKQWKTAGQGAWDFEALRAGKHKVGVRLPKELVSRYEVPDPVEHNLT